MASKMQRSAEFDEQFLTCAICMLHFRDPKILPCLHSFCKECLQLWATKQQPLECPTCRKPVSLPDQGVDGLKSNFYVSNLLDFAAVKKGAGPGVPCQVCEGKEGGARSWCVQCAVLLCESCTNTHRRFPAMKGHQIVSQENLEASEDVPSGFQRKVFCPKHEDQVLTFYCEPCQTLVCVACTVVDHRPGEQHNPVEIGSVAERKKRDLQELLEKVEPREKVVRAALGDVETEISELPTSADAAIKEATEYFDQLMALLQDRKEEVVEEIGLRRQEVGKCLEEQKEEMEFELAGLTSASEFCKQALEHGSDVHVIEVEGQARQRVEELLTTPADLTARPSLVVFSEGTAVAEFRDAVAKAGRVQASVRVDASKCSVEVKPAVVKCTNVSLLTIKDKNGQLFSVPKDDVTATLTHPWGLPVPTQVQEKGRGLWEISYTPELTRNHGLDVKVKGQSVAGSPYDVRVQSSHTPVLTIGREGSGEGELSAPVDVAVDKDGNIAVLENGNKRVQVFDPKTGQSLRCFPVDGENQWGIDIDSDGQFIVTSRNQLFSTATDKQAIDVYSREGELTKTLIPDCLRNPRGVAVLKDGRMVVADDTQKSCLLLQPDGSLIREIGKGQLQGPWFIAVNESRDMFFVTDFTAHKVFVFDLEGNLKVSFGTEGENEGELQSPTGITFDPAGNIIVVDTLTRRLQVFRPDGTYLRNVAIVRGREPAGISLTPDGHIAVVCMEGHCILLYTYK
ncbi:PREDICTED: tripartite motif-containing protein 2-like [Branchiostoma belcheri]|uniref:RING-type E3 ubiquitin transferase n=1 Tax=Branchiostoma belcheri TaxID=7741 RepID=A0A6P4YEJ9_BRABE|nr:PREDICTED: tripartite motif-containing protein 2-like [Branchiostoma belcheri]